MGYQISNSISKIVIRYFAGKSISVNKNQIKTFEKVPGSLMPPGLTAGLTKEEFGNLVAFLSELGKPGKYRVPNERFVRRWEFAVSDKVVSERVSDAGMGYVTSGNAKIAFSPIYSKVSGDLPIDELPVIGKSNNSYSFVKFPVEVLSAGVVRLSMNSVIGITASVGQTSIALSGQNIEVNLPPGMHERSEEHTSELQ